MGLEIWREITTEYNGRAIKGSFKFLDGVVTVRSKAAQVRGQTPEQLANTLLRATEWLKIGARLIEADAIHRFNTLTRQMSAFGE